MLEDKPAYQPPSETQTAANTPGRNRVPPTVNEGAIPPPGDHQDPHSPPSPPASAGSWRTGRNLPRVKPSRVVASFAVIVLLAWLVSAISAGSHHGTGQVAVVQTPVVPSPTSQPGVPTPVTGEGPPTPKEQKTPSPPAPKALKPAWSGERSIDNRKEFNLVHSLEAGQSASFVITLETGSEEDSLQPGPLKGNIVQWTAGRTPYLHDCTSALQGGTQENVALTVGTWICAESPASPEMPRIVARMRVDSVVPDGEYKRYTFFISAYRG